MANERKYCSIFKCRLCGEIYEDGTMRGDHTLATKYMLATLTDLFLMPQAPELTEIHSCKDGSLGTSDFQGLKLKETE